MKEILLFAGTTEGRKLSGLLAGAGVRHTVCVATEYGEIVLDKNPLVTVRRGRMEQEQMREMMREGNFCAVVDATHPYAEEATRHIHGAVRELRAAGREIPCLRLKREELPDGEDGADKRRIVYFKTNEACEEALRNTEGNILLTTGSKELSVYCVSESIKQRLYVRILPSMESLTLCMEQGICGRQILAMQGPFTAQMNEAVIRQYHISHLVTKESGVSGGYYEKLEAAQKTGVQVYAIGRPKEKEEISFAQVCAELEKICGRRLAADKPMEITLVGAGMGQGNCLTREAEEVIGAADFLFGAERFLAGLHSEAECHPFYQAKQIIPGLRKVQERNLYLEKRRVVVLFSGDSGFYSGAQALYQALKREIEEKRLDASLRVLPGISSVAYLASCIGESYQDAAVYSMHGKKLYNLARRIKESPKTFLLTSGAEDINRLGEALTEAGLTACEIVVGYGLSWEGQRIERCTPEECRSLREEGLYTCFVRNPHAEKRRLTQGIADGEFVRGSVPMTKEEVREVSISKLRLREGSVVYDIGSGTGSVAVEIAGLSDDIQVYAIERMKEAASLIGKNKEKFMLENITVKEAEAPEGLAGLPRATHAFIGGSGGRLKEILAALRQRNPGMRVVVNAVTVETVCEMRNFMSTNRLAEEEVVQIQVNRAKKAGEHHLMRAENPVWIYAFTFGGQEGGVSED